MLKLGQAPVAWNEIFAIFLWINPEKDEDQMVSFQHIMVTATDEAGGREVLARPIL